MGLDSNKTLIELQYVKSPLLRYIYDNHHGHFQVEKRTYTADVLYGYRKGIIKDSLYNSAKRAQLPDNIIQSSWSGIVSRTRNSSQIFEKIDENIFAAGCYNGSGIGVGTLFGEQIAIKASNENTKEIETIEARNKPTWLPPQPFLNLGVKIRLIYERLRARSEI